MNPRRTRPRPEPSQPDLFAAATDTTTPSGEPLQSSGASPAGVPTEAAGNTVDTQLDATSLAGRMLDHSSTHVVQDADLARRFFAPHLLELRDLLRRLRADDGARSIPSPATITDSGVRTTNREAASRGVGDADASAGPGADGTGGAIS